MKCKLLKEKDDNTKLFHRVSKGVACMCRTCVSDVWAWRTWLVQLGHTQRAPQGLRVWWTYTGEAACRWHGEGRVHMRCDVQGKACP